MKKKAKPKFKLHSAHDLAFKYFMSKKEVAQEVLEKYLPPEISGLMNLKSLRIAKDSFVDKKLSQYFSDILYEVKLQGKTACVYCLFDHKSTDDRFTGFQLHKYMVRIWEMYFKQHKNVQYLPVVIPLVIYNGKKKWGVDRRFISLFENTARLEKFIPQFEYYVIDLSQIADDQIKGDVLLKIAFFALKYIMDTELQEKLPEILELLGQVKDKETAQECLEVLVRYFAASAKNLEQKSLEKAVTRYAEKGGKTMQTIAEKLIRQGKREGKLEGEREGKREGKWEATVTFAERALATGSTEEYISLITGLTAENIQDIKFKKKIDPPKRTNGKERNRDNQKKTIKRNQ